MCINFSPALQGDEWVGGREGWVAERGRWRGGAGRGEGGEGGGKSFQVKTQDHQLHSDPLS